MNDIKKNHESIYNFILTMIIAFAIVFAIYASIPYYHYSLYLVETKNNSIKK